MGGRFVEVARQEGEKGRQDLRALLFEFLPDFLLGEMVAVLNAGKLDIHDSGLEVFGFEVDSGGQDDGADQHALKLAVDGTDSGGQTG